MRLYIRNPGFGATLRERVQAATTQAAEVGAEKSRELVRAPGTGVRHPGYSAHSSAEGEAPASQTGELERSIESGGLEPAGNTVRARYGSNAMHARFLELGTATIRPRPFLRTPAIHNKADMLEAYRGLL